MRIVRAGELVAKPDYAVRTNRLQLLQATLTYSYTHLVFKCLYVSSMTIRYATKKELSC
jgi:hypothetical protein